MRSGQFGPISPGVIQALRMLHAEKRPDGTLPWGAQRRAANAVNLLPQQINEAWRKYKHMPEYAVPAAE